VLLTICSAFQRQVKSVADFFCLAGAFMASTRSSSLGDELSRQLANKFTSIDAFNQTFQLHLLEPTSFGNVSLGRNFVDGWGQMQFWAGKCVVQMQFEPGSSGDRSGRQFQAT
jgi:hypothetical protein